MLEWYVSILVYGYINDLINASITCKYVSILVY